MQFIVRRRKPPLINIVSLIDILAILLIFFVVAARFSEEFREVRLQLPESQFGSPRDQITEPLIISITADSKLYFDSKEIELRDLVAKIREAQQTRSIPSQFAVRADEAAPLGFVIRVSEAMQQAGLKDMNLIARPPGDANP